VSRSTVAIVGRPNVGKSTLFNRILGGRPAIVDERPGVTRDRNFARAEWAGRSFWLVDTGGWIPDSDALSTAVRRQVELAIADADVIAFLVDTQAGVHPADHEVAGLLRAHHDRVVLVANKADELAEDTSYLVFHELGLGDPHPVSAATGRGSGDLLDRLVQALPAGANEAAEGIVNVAVVGRPNVGKSSMVNRLLGVERHVVAPEAGTTRDAVDSPLRYEQTTLNFIDTAGLRKRSKVEDEIEFYSTLRTHRTIERADVCVLVVDAASGVHAQDIKIGQAAWDRGAGLIIAVNKWDLILEKDPNTAARGQRDLAVRVPLLSMVPFVYVSALSGQRVRRLLELIVEVQARRQRRIPTAEVNRVLRDLVARHEPPTSRGVEVKLLYGSQIGTAPPAFALVANRPEGISETYERYLDKGFRDRWDLEGTPIRMRFRKKRGRS
jgi:GTP-binding protein